MGGVGVRGNRQGQGKVAPRKRAGPSACDSQMVRAQLLQNYSRALQGGGTEHSERQSTYPTTHNLERIYIWFWNISWNFYMILTCFKDARVNEQYLLSQGDLIGKVSHLLHTSHGVGKVMNLLSQSFLLACMLNNKTQSFKGRQSQLTQSPPTALTSCAQKQTPDTEAGNRHSNAHTYMRPRAMTPASSARLSD